MPASPPDVHLAAFEAQRPRLLRLGYRMTGSLAEAEDVVQDAWIRWERVEQAVESPAAYLTRIVTRLCLDRADSARARRETYYGSWLPDPLVETAQSDFGEMETMADDITLTLMLALERLSPLERAAFLLHDVFDMELAEVATTLDRDSAAVRQLAVRARRHVEEARPLYKVDREEADRITRAFFVASHDGDTAALAKLLADNVTLTSDGVGRVLAFRNVISGIGKVLRLFAGLRRKYHERPEMLGWLTIDGLPGYVSRDRGGVFQTTALDICDGRIAAIYITRNPEKLGRVAQLVGASADI